MREIGAKHFKGLPVVLITLEHHVARIEDDAETRGIRAVEESAGGAGAYGPVR